MHGPRGMFLVSAVDVSATVVRLAGRYNRAARASAAGSIHAARANDGVSFGHESRDAQEGRED
jgi:hypothetical protein